jgi:hypothetical protein
MSFIKNITAKKNIQVVSPSFRNNKKYPDISRYPCGQTVGYINLGEESFYIQIISITKIADQSEVLTLVPIIKWDNETTSRLKDKMKEYIIEIYYLDRPKSTTKYFSIEFNKEFQQNIVQLYLKKE